MSKGLSDKSDIKEEIVKIDEHKAIRYKIVEETIDLDALRQEKAILEEQLSVPKPTEEMLIEQGKGIDTYYTTDKTAIQNQITAINEILK